jgi:hypothetical protein
MPNLYKLYKLIPVCCEGMKTQYKLIKKYNKLFSYIIENCNDHGVDNYSTKQLYDLYISFMNTHTINSNLVEKLCDVDNWIKKYPSKDKITKVFRNLGVGGYFGENIDIYTYTQRLVNMLIEFHVVQLTFLDTYAKIHNDDSFYEHLDEISMRPIMYEKTINNGNINIYVSVSYNISKNIFVRKDRTLFDEIIYEKIVPEYYNIDDISDTIIPFPVKSDKL